MCHDICQNGPKLNSYCWIRPENVCFGPNDAFLYDVLKVLNSTPLSASGLLGQLRYFLASYQLVRNVCSMFWPVWWDKHLEVLTWHCMCFDICLAGNLFSISLQVWFWKWLFRPKWSAFMRDVLKLLNLTPSSFWGLAGRFKYFQPLVLWCWLNWSVLAYFWSVKRD